MQGQVYIADQMNQPAQRHRTFFRRCLGVCEGLFTLADPVENVGGGIGAGLSREVGGLQWIIDIMPLGVVVMYVSRVAPAAEAQKLMVAIAASDFIRPSARTHEDEPGQIAAGACTGERPLPFSAIRVRFQDFARLLLEVG